MKNLSLALNVVLILAVGFLYYNTFAGNKAGGQKNGSKKAGDTACRSTHRVAYFNIDSVENSFQYYKEYKADFEKQKEDADNGLKAQEKKFNDRLMVLQQQAVTPADQEKAKQELGKMQDDLQKRKSDAESRIYQFGSTMQEDVLKKITDFLKDYNTPQKYDYIMQYSQQLFYYKDSTLDVTPDLVKGLNERYKDMYKKKDK